MSDCMEQLDRYINHRICKMLPSKMNVEIPATTTYLQVASLDTKVDHTQDVAYRMNCETNTPYAGDDSRLLHK